MWLPTDDRYREFLDEFMPFNDKFYARQLTAADWRAWFETSLRRVVAHAQNRSVFYSERLTDINADTLSLDNLTDLPFTTKTDLRERLFDVLSGDIADATFFYETTGTTGRATPCPRDGKEIIASNTHITASWASIFDHHFPDHRPAIGLMGPTEVHSFGDTLGDIARNVGSCNAKIWPYSPVIGFKKALQLMKDLRLEVICCTPGVCLNLAKAARFHGYDLEKDFAVKLFFLTGEMCTPALASNIDSVWGVKTYNILYGSQEAFVMGTACKNRTMHLSQPNYIVEVLDPDSGASLGTTGTGELCITTVVAGVKPLIRYRTGDIVKITDTTCDCELPGPRIDVVGRVLDRIDLGRGRYLASDIEEAVLDGVTGCVGFQIVIDQFDGSDHVTVRLEMLPGTDIAPLTAGVLERFADRFGVTSAVEYVDEVDQVTSTGAFVSWKAARILDRRGAIGHEEKVAAALATKRGFNN
jgi:phenylacetate-CoA ligase